MYVCYLTRLPVSRLCRVYDKMINVCGVVDMKNWRGKPSAVIWDRTLAADVGSQRSTTGVMARSFIFKDAISTAYAIYSEWLLAGRLRGRSLSPGRVKNIHFSMSSRPALGSTQPPIQWVPTALFSGVKCDWGVRLTIHLQLAPWSRKRGAILYIHTPPPHAPSRRSA
jgi:hypothetical protein